MNRIFCVAGLAMLLSVSCSKKQLSPEAKAVVAKYDQRIADLENYRASLSRGMHTTDELLLKFGATNLLKSDLAGIATELSKMDEKLQAVEKEKWETELRKLEFILNQTR